MEVPMLTHAKPMMFVPTAQPEVAKRFYGETLGLPLVSDDAYAVVFDLAGTTLRVEKVPEFVPQPFTVLGWKVTSIVRTMADLGTRGVRFERYDVLQQDEHGVWTAPGSGAKIAWFKDPDGNTLSLTEC
jgi:catechol 2,3-dioxygenase-like lactoylglutathione lyase family enzyme